MRHFLHQTFIAHPNSVDESYLEHLRFAITFSAGLFGAALAALLHAFVPCLCEKTASKKITALYNRLHNR